MGRCEEFFDNKMLNFNQENLEYQAQRDFIIDTLLLNSDHYPEGLKKFYRDLRDEELVNEFTFKIFQFIRFEPDIMEKIIISKEPAERLQLIFRALKRIKKTPS